MTPPQMVSPSARWFFMVDKRKNGPVSFAKLQDFVAVGKLKPSDMVLQESTTQWQSVKAVPGLIAPQPAAAPKEPPPPELSLQDTLKGLTKEKSFKMLAWGAVAALVVVLLFGAFSLAAKLIPAKTDPVALTFVRNRPPSQNYKVQKQQKGNGNELTVDMGEMLKRSGYKCRTNFLYSYTGSKPPNPVDWKTLEIVFHLEGPGSAVNDAATANLFTREKVGEAIAKTQDYGGGYYDGYWNGGYWWHHHHYGAATTNQNKVDCALTIDGKEYIKQAVIRLKDYPKDITYVTLSTSLFDETTVKNIYHAKSVSIRIASTDSPIRFDLGDDVLAGFCDLVDQIFKGK
jgi:hypothetical protein